MILIESLNDMLPGERGAGDRLCCWRHWEARTHGYHPRNADPRSQRCVAPTTRAGLNTIISNNKHSYDALKERSKYALNLNPISIPVIRGLPPTVSGRPRRQQPQWRRPRSRRRELKRRQRSADRSARSRRSA